MIDDEVARGALALLGTAAAMLVEDTHSLLMAPPRSAAAAEALAAAINRLGTDLSSIGAAAAVLSRRAAGAAPVASTAA
jgi:hypothetical protein